MNINLLFNLHNYISKKEDNMVLEYILNKKCFYVKQTEHVPEIGTKIIYQGIEATVNKIIYNITDKVIKIILKDN